MKQGDLGVKRDGVHACTAGTAVLVEAVEEPDTQESERP